MKRLLAALLVLLSFATLSLAQKESDVWLRLLQVTNYAATVRASFVPGCQHNVPRSQTPQYRLICPKLHAIPNQTIESAALPYIRRHVAQEVAQQAIGFWSSVEGRIISEKIVVEIATGVHNQLTAEDLKVLDNANRSKYGRALNAFAVDKEGSAAVARAMLRYEP